MLLISLITSCNRDKKLLELKDTLQLAWSALPEKAVNNAMRVLLASTACVAGRVEHKI